MEAVLPLAWQQPKIVALLEVHDADGARLPPDGVWHHLLLASRAGAPELRGARRIRIVGHLARNIGGADARAAGAGTLRRVVVMIARATGSWVFVVVASRLGVLARYSRYRTICVIAIPVFRIENLPLPHLHGGSVRISGMIGVAFHIFV